MLAVALYLSVCLLSVNHLSRAHVPGVLPPLVVQHLDRALLLQLQDGQGDRVAPLGALRGGDSIPDMSC